MYSVCLSDNFLLRFSLNAHKSGKHFQIINKHFVVGKHYKVTVFIHTVERVGGSVPRVENRTSRHVLIPVRRRIAAMWKHKTDVVMAGHRCTGAGKPFGVLVAPIFVVDFARPQKPSNLQPEDVLAQGERVARDNGVVTVHLEHADFGFVDAVANHLIDAALDVRVVQNLRFNHNRLDVVIINAVNVVLVQTSTL